MTKKTRKTKRIADKIQRMSRKCPPIHKNGFVVRSTSDLYLRLLLNGKKIPRNQIQWNVFFPRLAGYSIGGSSETENSNNNSDNSKKYSKTVHGYTFLYSDIGTETGNEILCVAKKNSGSCFKIIFDLYTKSITVSIGYSARCSINKDLPISDGTKIMMQLILQLIFEHTRIKEYTQIVLDDNSVKYISSFENKPSSTLRYGTYLMDMCFLSTGCTWYASIVPMFLSYIEDDLVYQRDRRHMMTVLWGDFMKRLPSHVHEYIQKYVIGSSAELACTVLNRVRNERTHSIIFYKFMAEMLDAMGVHSLRGKPWAIGLRNGKILSPTMYECRNSKEWMIPAEALLIISDEEYAIMKENLQVKPQIIDLNINSINNVSQRRYYNPSEPVYVNYDAVSDIDNIGDIDMLLTRIGSRTAR